MARAKAVQRRPRRTIIGVTSVVAVVALLTTLAVTAEGYDAQETPRLESAVWVTRDDGKYARVNTDLGEIDTVRTIEKPSSVIQLGPDAFVLSQSDRLLWPVDAANPVDFTAAATEEGSSTGAVAEGLSTPEGTRSVAVSGKWVVYRTSLNAVFLGRIDPSGEVDPSVTRPVDPFAETSDPDDEDAPVYTATAAAVSDDGRVAMYSPDEEGVRWFDATLGEFVGDIEKVPSAPSATTLVELAIVGEHWVLSDAAGKRLWLDNGDGPVQTNLTNNALLQSSTSTADTAYLIDPQLLLALDLDSGDLSTVGEGSGEPARPVVVDGVAYAAWISPTGGSLWSSDGDDSIPLEVAEEEFDDSQAIVPVIRSNGSRAVLNESTTGMLWTMPDGELVPMEQWTLDDAELEAGTVVVDDVAEQEPPVAVADSFGVRRGSLVRLPLLLNDHDPNKKDVLTVDAASLSGLSDPAFGDLGLVSNNQEAVIKMRADVGGATFTYSVTDGSAVSTPVTVSLTVVPDDQNTAPVWCGVDACAQDWPSPQVAPGGIITVPVLAGWVDPEGDPMVLIDARKEDPGAKVTVVPNSDGTLTVRHTDPNAAGGTVFISVSVADSRGATSVKKLELVVTSSPVLDVAPVAIVAGVGEKATVVVADHVYGGSGFYRLIDATPVSSGLLVVPNSAAGEIELTASEVGDYALTYVVQDVKTKAEQSAIVRVSVVGGDAPLAMAPLTTFVRANEDTTIDVLAAVQNPSGRVLLASSAISGDPNLRVSVVGQSAVRVSGSTADGLPGRIGTATITVTDGANGFVEGLLTVFLAPASTGVGPIAVPDTVTVRAGGQVDIPVTDNDVSPRGERLMVLPTVDESKRDGELVFVSGDMVRYLAPTKAGTYDVSYTVYLGAEPSRTDSTTITITVIPAGANRDPQPPILTAHALSGQTVSIPVDGYGMDPDGDSIVLAGVDQPKAGQGVASISGDGTAIIYTATGNGISGSQVAFNYTVRDSEGAEAEGAVRVGVLDDKLADGAPITYSDYVRTQKGATTAVTVLPLLNDIDPADGELELISLEPYTPNVEGAEYARLLGLINPETDLEKGTVLLNAGDVLGTHSYVYKVQASKSTSFGLIVVTVADEGALDHPEVADTVVTAKNRVQLEEGIDVVTGKVQWATGDVSALKLDIWGSDSSKYSVSGQKISGPAPKAGTIVPFSLTGSDAAGNDVVSYGFLRIPAFNDMRLQLRPAIETIRVGEEKSIEFDILDVIDIAKSDSLEVRDDDAYVVQRANSNCVPSGRTEATYSAGREAPWTDYCAVPVRLEGQSRWTILAVPIQIGPKDPLAELGGLTRTIAPGDIETVGLLEDMITWQGGRVGETDILDFTTSYSGGGSFVVAHDEATDVVTITTSAKAKPGTRESIGVSVTSYGGLTAAITLVVGISPPDTPRGATFVEQCDVRQGASCAVTVIGQAGEYDPFLGDLDAGLTLDAIGAGGSVNCAVASISMVGPRIIATYPSSAKPAGGECIVPFTVKDAQGRVGAGQLTLDILGYPQQPASIVTKGYTGNSVTLRVDLGEAANAHPSVSSVSIWEGGVRVPSTSCTFTGAAAYDCVVSGLVNGAHHSYTARAENSVGDSLDTTAVDTNAYQQPTISNLVAEAVYTPTVTSEGVATVKLTISSDADAQSFRINDSQVELRTGSTTEVRVDMQPGNRTISVVPISTYQPPLGGGNTGETRTVNVTAIGKPSFTSNNPSATPGTTTLTVSIGFNANAAPASLVHVTYLAWTGGAAPTCSADANGDLVVSGATISSVDNPVITVPESNEFYYFRACGTNSFGVAMSGVPGGVYVGFVPDPPAGVPSYTINPTAVFSGSTAIYELMAPVPTITGAPEKSTGYFNGLGMNQATSFSLPNHTLSGTVTARFCRTNNQSFCSGSVNVGWVNAPNVVRVTFPSCYGDPFSLDDDPNISAPARPYADVVPSLPDLVTGNVTYTVNWGGGYTLNPVTSAAVPPCDPI